MCQREPSTEHLVSHVWKTVFSSCIEPDAMSLALYMLVWWGLLFGDWESAISGEQSLWKLLFQPWLDCYAVSRLVGYVCEAADCIWLWRKQLACSGARSCCSWFVENSAAFLLFAHSREGRSSFLVMAMKDQDHSTQITLLHSLLQAVLTGIADESTAVCKQPKITN